MQGRKPWLFRLSHLAAGDRRQVCRTTNIYASPMASTRSSTLGPESRPVAIPDNFEQSSVEIAETKIQLPRHIWWSDPPLVFDLTKEKDRNRLYELVLTEGSEGDVSEFIDFQTLLKIWAELFLPRYVRRQWESWFERQGVSFS